MLRRTQRIVLRDDDETPETPFVAEPAIATGPAPDRRNLEQWLAEVERAGEQQKSEKKGLEALRAEVQRTLVTSDGEVISGPGQVWRGLLKPSRLALLAVALVAGGVAAYFAATTNEQPDTIVAAPVPAIEQPQAEPVPPPAAPLFQILVARHAIALGDRLTAENVEWKSWPEDALRDDYITEAAKPEAVEQMAGAIARFEFFPGEPIRGAKLATPGDGYLSAVLEPGQLGVAIQVMPDVAAGGFIQPNDHVDVILTQAVGGRQVADTVLSNVRVLAVAHRLGDVGNRAYWDESPVRPPEEGTAPAAFGEPVIATLALDSEQAEIITAARNAGVLSLALRSISDFGAPRADNFGELTANQRIRQTSPFWVN